MRRTLVALLAGVLLGLLAGWLLFSDDDSATTRVVGLAAAPPETSPEGRLIGQPRLSLDQSALRRPSVDPQPAPSRSPAEEPDRSPNGQSQKEQQVSPIPNEGQPSKPEGTASATPVQREEQRSVLVGQARLGYVDSQRAILDTSEARAVKARLKRAFDEQQRALDERHAELLREQAALERQRREGALSLEEATSRQGKLDGDAAALVEARKSALANLSEEETRLTRGLHATLAAATREVAATGGYLLVFDKSECGLLYASTATDLTDEVVRVIDGRRSTPAP